MVYTLSKIVHLCFALYRLAEDFSNPGNVKFEGLVHLVRFIRDNKNLGFKYYAWIEDAPLSENFIQAIIKSDKQLMFFRIIGGRTVHILTESTGSYIVLYQGGPIDHWNHVTGPVSKYSAESENNVACTARMNLAHFRMINNDMINKDPY